MDLDFLPNLPKSDLDDRRFEDLVEECLLRIPRYCPEWTNYNPSDPGITLIELFAWLTDQMMQRFNQVPRRHYVAFLELLGVRLQPPSPAQTDLTFYLAGELPQRYTIPAGVEVATERTSTEAAIVFSTDRPLVIDKPRLCYFLTANQTEATPQILRDAFANLWNEQTNGAWSGPELPIFNDQPQPGNCFYLVFGEAELIEGNVIALTVRGQAATPTGIDPNNPPRRWEAWDGAFWQPVLLENADDATQGFSFNEIARQGGNPLQGADILLHLPQSFPVTQFGTYRGRWLRCAYTMPRLTQSSYNAAPRIVGLSVQATGGTVNASQGRRVERESLGASNGKPGQTCQLREQPILPRQEDEYLVVVPPGGLPQRWLEVSDFADSGPEDLHYTLDSVSGTIQFGPLIREPSQLRLATYARSRQQRDLSRNGTALTEAAATGSERINHLEHQYGAIPPRGSRLIFAAYRTGGGQRGNVQRHTLRVVKAAVPYVTGVTNHGPARNGSDAETLEQAALRVPQLLRSRDRAITPEDFEILTLQAGRGAVARARCLPADLEHPGTTTLLVVPQASEALLDQGQGLMPDLFALTPELEQQVLSYLNDRKLLGTQIRCRPPDYVGVAVQTEVALEPAYNNPDARREILTQLRTALYRFLNPISGGNDGRGWPFGRPVYPSDIVAIFQRVAGIRYLGAVQLFALRRTNGGWTRLPPAPVVDPGPHGLIASWADPHLRSAHIVNVA
ncbi:MAG: putative baseplate assembly protein [Spirulinaceae cyanobacterium SM2_1_0]|nr:putative baseplate assembly protein [Spirulinaceae cyanobacterium SM2_1_0]